MKCLSRFLSGAVLAVAVMLGAGSAANAMTLTADWFTISSNDPDMNSQSCCGNVFYNEVGTQLGPNGLPIINLSGNTGSYTPYYVNTSSNANGDTLVSDLDSSGEITWWSPALNPNVTATGSTTVTLPYNNGSMFPTNGTGGFDGGSNGYQAAIFTGSIDVPTSEDVAFSVGADDDAFLYVDGILVCSLGGVHGSSPATCTTQDLDPGDYSVDLFYADIHQTGAGLNFSVETTGVTTSPVTPPTGVPEPMTLSLFGASLIGFAVARRRSRA